MRLFYYARRLAADIAPKMVCVLPLSGIAPTASIIQLVYKPMTARITEFGAPVRRAAVSYGRKIIDFEGKTFSLGMAESGYERTKLRSRSLQCMGNSKTKICQGHYRNTEVTWLRLCDFLEEVMSELSLKIE